MTFTRKFFDPLAIGGIAVPEGSVGFTPEGRREDTYIYSPRMILALNVALATKRPLLVSGEPGSGKSSLARNVASVLGRTYYERVITSRTQAADLLWNFDALRRLSDATAGADRQELLSPEGYVEPGPVWWAFDPATAAKPRGTRPFIDPGLPPGGSNGTDAVLLLDEIDKADPDVPNDLLEPFGVKSFTVRETGERIKAMRDILLILTTNGERELPPAFLRRCVALATDPPTRAWFIEVAKRKLGDAHLTLYGEVADKIMDLRRAAETAGQRPPGTAEFLDAVLACRDLSVNGESEEFKAITLAAAWKQPETAVLAQAELDR
jgi:MoxR-like ATPase